jgi:uncharacterized membrane protein
MMNCDPLRAARGVIYGTLVGLLFWLTMFLLIFVVPF